jgi:hypothetical protein
MSRKTGGFDPQKDLKDLTGKVAIVTGGKSVAGSLAPRSTMLIPMFIYIKTFNP